MERQLVPEKGIANQLINIGRAVGRVETICRHLKESTYASVLNPETALVPLPGTPHYFNWLGILLQNRTCLAPFLQHWMRDGQLSIGGCPIRRIRAIASHLCAQPMVVDAW